MGFVIVTKNPDKENGVRYLKERKGCTSGYAYKYTLSFRAAKVFFNKDTAEEWRNDCEDPTATLKDIATAGRRNDVYVK